MLHRPYIRIWLTVIWITSFVVMWTIFQTTIPSRSMIDSLEKAQENIAEKEWLQASKNMDNFTRQWESNRVLIEANNATEEILTFQQALAQARALIEQKEVSAIEYVSGLKQMTDSITKVFPAP